MSTPVMHYARRLALGATSTPDKRLQFVSCASRGAPTHNNYPGVRGYRGIPQLNSFEGVKDVGLSIQAMPSPDELVYWLKYIFGAASGTAYTLTEALPAFYAMVDAGNTVYLHSGEKVNTAVFSSDPNTPLTLALETIGLTRADGASFPSLSNLTAKRPYTHHECTLSIDGDAYTPAQVQLSVNNNLDGNRYLNSQSRTAILDGERLIQLAVMLPFGSSEYAAFKDMDLNAGLEAVLTYAYGAESLAFTMPAVSCPEPPTEIRGKNGELMGQFIFTARKPDDATAEISVASTND